MKIFLWDDAKNGKLIKERGVSFEEVVAQIQGDGLLDIYNHPNQGKYPGQKLFVVNIRGYACLVPFVENSDHIFLKTIIPSRKAMRKYMLREDAP